MKKVVINNYRWYVDENTKTVYENPDKTGASFPMSGTQLTAHEKIQVYYQLRFNY